MPRPTRAREYQPLYADSDSEGAGNSENEATPKPVRRPKGKKRVSDVFVPGAEGSSPNRVPLRNVNINDDEAEKRKRRKSMKVVAIVDPEEAEAGPSSPSGVQVETPKASRQAKQRQQLMAVAQTPAINVPKDVMSSNFEEWMKMATDNKINAANSWNFALIDYFHDMSLLRNNTDNSINFQKASCTLDGCVKIWTSRVDSVGTETGKLLSNLASEGRAAEEDENALSDNPDGDPTQRAKRPKTHRPESTLAKNAAQLRSKKLDLEFSVDPLFKKTCADFDEGGAQGLLMNHLSLGVGSEGSMRVIFDASDSMGKVRDEEEDVVEPEDPIDLSYLRIEFIQDPSFMEDAAISHSLAGFSFSKDAFALDSNFMNETFCNDDVQGDDDDDDNFGAPQDAPMDMDGGGGNDDVQDFFVGDQAVGDDYGGMDIGGDDQGGFDGGHGVDGDEAAAGGDGAAPARPGAFEPFDPRRAPNERDLIMAMTDANAEGGSLDYFDQTFMKNWAGPEHWKLRKVIRRPDATAANADASKQKREKKEPFKIDFLTPSEKSQKEIMKEIFAPVSKGGSITLPNAASKSAKKSKRSKAKDKEKRNEQTLPDDMHFSSRQLVTLFLKPKFALRMRGYRARLNEGDGEVDENFWAQAAADQAAGRNGEEVDETADGGAIPFNTQFFHDEYDDGPGFDDIYDGDGPMPTGDGMAADVEPGEQDLLAATAGQTRRVRPEFVNYAKRAKRVDVRKLKENIWKGLDIVVSHSPPENEADEDLGMEMDESRPPTDPEESRVFTSVISGLQKSYPKEKMEEISTSFCFICLLHLANERGLKIEVGGDDPDDNAMEDDNEKVEDKRVGDIWGLKIYRDPTATPSA
ncbi:barren [Rickenella mellea]|uniref:Condensin complex subunit 2 n=1 Tax=Rickenella mellea TaxID=50990 RepID=A0A4Y7Q907_9AGAM|nr:barren [Rickenella mellea]